MKKLKQVELKKLNSLKTALLCILHLIKKRDWHEPFINAQPQILPFE